nr:hypothetical protein [Catenulispora pinistramenti]
MARFRKDQRPTSTKLSNDFEPASRFSLCIDSTLPNLHGRRRRRIPYLYRQPIDEQLEDQTTCWSTFKHGRVCEGVGNQFGRDKNSVIDEFGSPPTQQRVGDTAPGPAGRARRGGEVLSPRSQKTGSFDDSRL